MSPLAGRTALVTGASRGLGRAIAIRLASDGALVAVHYGGNEAAAKQTVAEIEQAGGQAFTIGARLGTDGDLDRLFAGLETGLAGQPLDILVNNAGVFTGAFETTTPEEFDQAFAVNVRALFFLTQRALPLLRDGGRIINMSSGVTRLAIPQTVYQMTKAAVDVLGRSLAQLLGPRGITVNTVQPGVTDTDMNAWLRDNPEATRAIEGITALGRLGRPADIADVVAFLASDDARWVTGHAIEATGGFFLGPNG
ncbi:SDR family oxidoreductase [Kitasatospora sp. NPDC005856]|uniref:SDR family oxidoreductase n=1 Tax=Kitasatospora sp. NPDC005856 TaxID=3154566 RepID=UPI0033F41AC3